MGVPRMMVTAIGTTALYHLFGVDSYGVDRQTKKEEGEE
jgi:hypothetical protein